MHSPAGNADRIGILVGCLRVVAHAGSHGHAAWVAVADTAASLSGTCGSVSQEIQLPACMESRPGSYRQCPNMEQARAVAVSTAASRDCPPGLLPDSGNLTICSWTRFTASTTPPQDVSRDAGPGASPGLRRLRFEAVGLFSYPHSGLAGSVALPQTVGSHSMHLNELMHACAVFPSHHVLPGSTVEVQPDPGTVHPRLTCRSTT